MNSQLYLKERVIYIDESVTLSYKRGYLIIRSNEQIKKCRIGNWKNRYPLLERMLRLEPRCAAKIDSNTFIISYNGSIFKYLYDKNTLIKEHNFERGMNNPLQFLSMYNASVDANEVYYGEYIWNVDKGPVAIYMRKNSEWEKVFEFPQNTIDHIHGIINDPFQNRFLILSGDGDNESGIWAADYDFKRVVPLLIGKQEYRACFLCPVKDGFIYATDSPLVKNHVYYVKNDQDYIRDIIEEYELPGPCIYGTTIDNSMFFSTSVEPDSRLSKWHYRVTYRLGSGVQTRCCYVIERDGEGKYYTRMKVKKDILPMWLFQFGNILFPNNQTHDVYTVMQSNCLRHGWTYQLKLNHL